MFMTFVQFTSINGATWCNSPQQAEDSFRQVLPYVQPLVTDRGCSFNTLEMTVSSGQGMAFFAKNKATLLAALRTCPQGVNITSRNGGLGMFTGSFDHEKLGAWAKNRKAGNELWNTHKPALKGSGATKAGFLTAYGKKRLDDRAYFLVVAPSSQMRNNARHVAIHDTQAPLASLPGFLSGKLTKEQAVDNLFEDLLIS